MTIKERIAALKAINSLMEDIQCSLDYMRPDDGSDLTEDDWRYEDFTGKKLLLPMIEKLADKI